MIPRCRKTVLFCAALLGLAAVPAAQAGASPGCTLRWITPAGGSWGTAANWSAARVPAATDDVCIPGPTALTVQLASSGGTMTVNSLNLGGSVTLAVVGTGPALTLLDLTSTGTVGRQATLTLSSSASGQQSGVAVSSPLLTNRGTIVANGGTSTNGAIVASGVSNLGTIHATGPTSLFGTVINRGTLTVDPGQTAFSMSSNPNNIAFENAKGGSITGAGTLEDAVGAFVQAGGTITGTPVLLQGDASSSSVALSLTGGGAAHFQDASPLLVTGTLASNQSIVVSGGGLVASNGAFTNAGTVKLQQCSSFGGVVTAGGSFVNTGTLEVAGVSCALLGSGPYTNSGQINVDALASLVPTFVTVDNAGGTITNRGTFQMVGGTFQEGAGRVTGSAVDLKSGSTLDLAGQGASSFVLRGANMIGDVAPGQHLDIEPPQSGPPTTAVASFTNSGAISLGATLALPAGATLTNSGQLATVATSSLDGGLVNSGLLRVPAHTGLAVTGPVSTSGMLEIGIDPAGGSGQLSGNGTVSLGGTLKIDTLTQPPSGQSFTVVTWAQVSGTFAKTSFGGHRYAVSYSATGCVVTVK